MLPRSISAPSIVCFSNSYHACMHAFILHLFYFKTGPVVTLMGSPPLSPPVPINLGHGLTTPAYLQIVGHRNCLGQAKQGSAWILCMPSAKPHLCQSHTWEAVRNSFEGDMCPTSEEGTGRMEQKPSRIGLAAPSYLSVPGHRNCLGQHSQNGGATSLCRLQSKPMFCSQEAWDALKTAFSGMDCPQYTNTARERKEA